MQKYFLDHKIQFDKYLSEQDKKIGELQLRHFGKRRERILKKITALQEDKKQELLNEQLACENNIDFNIGHMYMSLCQFIPETMSTYMAEHSGIAIPEIIKSYRMACEIFGISRNGIFSKVTEEMMGQQKQTPLRQRETELSALEAEARGYDEAEALKNKLEQKEGQNIGE